MIDDTNVKTYKVQDVIKIPAHLGISKGEGIYSQFRYVPQPKLPDDPQQN